MAETRKINTAEALKQRFGENIELGDLSDGPEVLRTLAARGSCRYFTDQIVDLQMLRALSALALSSPSKSDLQQRDIIIVQNADVRQRLNALVSSQAWIASAPAFLVFCGNNRRQRQVHEMRQREFANDHLDAFFNAAVDAGIALSAFAIAAEAVGLGCCPVSAIRNKAAQVSDLLELPDHVFPIAGLAVGWPEHNTPKVSMRLPVSATVHIDKFDDTGIEQAIDTYDRRRSDAQPYRTQLHTEEYGESDNYSWSEHTARHYSKPERADFGDFIRAKGFRLD